MAKAISRFEPITVLANKDQYKNARAMLDPAVRVIEASNNDSWVRDCGPTFVTNGEGDTWRRLGL